MAAETNMESLAAARMDDAARDSLIQQETECVFVFSGRDGWPSGVVMSYIFADGGLLADLGPRPQRGDRCAGRSQGHDRDQQPRRGQPPDDLGPGHRLRRSRDEGLVLPAVRSASQPCRPDQFRALLDSSNRVIFECRPVGAWTSHDSRRFPGDGRGGLTRAADEQVNPDAPRDPASG